MPKSKHQRARKDGWSNVEVSRLRRLLTQGADLSQLSQAFPGRTKQAIQAKMDRLGLKRTRRSDGWQKHHKALQIKYGFDPDASFPFRRIHEHLSQEGLI